MLSFVGLALVGGVWRRASLDVVGVAAALGGPVVLAVYFLAGEHGVRTRDPISFTTFGFATATVAWAVVAPWWSFPWNKVGAVDGVFATLTISGWWLVVYMVLLGTVVPFVLVLFSLQKLTAAQASIVGMTEPVVASVIAWNVLGEALMPVQVLGGVVVLAGVLIAENSR